MLKPAILVLLGADRVGKSTIATNTLKQFAQRNITGYKAQILHFSGPKPEHSSPIEQYTQHLDSVLQTKPQVLVCDRFGAEVAFYDKFRRNIDISHEWAQAAESYFAQRSSEIHVFLVKREWEWSKPHHVIEIEKESPGCTKWWVQTQLKMREAEHRAYYEYMFDYLDNHSTLPYKVLERTSLNFDIAHYVSTV